LNDQLNREGGIDPPVSIPADSDFVAPKSILTCDRVPIVFLSFAKFISDRFLSYICFGYKIPPVNPEIEKKRTVV
jgi:hypothetical protein